MRWFDPLAEAIAEAIRILITIVELIGGVACLYVSWEMLKALWEQRTTLDVVGWWWIFFGVFSAYGLYVTSFDGCSEENDNVQ